MWIGREKLSSRWLTGCWQVLPDSWDKPVKKAVIRQFGGCVLVCQTNVDGPA